MMPRNPPCVTAIIRALAVLSLVVWLPAQSRPPARDGSHDFDFEFGRWKTHLKRLVHPLSGSTQWVECDGTSVVSEVWNGKANLVELEVDCPSGHLEGLNLRLYNPESHEWSLNYSNVSMGTLMQPTIGEFNNSHGQFYDQERFNGRAVFVRFMITPVTPNSVHFEQSFSEDGGKTWETNWVADDTRIEDRIRK
jgi:hypothetical protein